MTPTRRDLLALAARAAALPGAAEFLTIWLRAAETHQHATGPSAPPEPPLLRDYRPRFFDPADFQSLEAFTEILIPSDETPGAREAHCAHYIDFLLRASDSVPATQAQWRAAMKALHQAGFTTASTEERLKLVHAMAEPESDHRRTHPLYSVYRLIKENTVFAFYTSRAGMIENLDYKGNSFNVVFPGCDHPEHHRV